MLSEPRGKDAASSSNAGEMRGRIEVQKKVKGVKVRGTRSKGIVLVIAAVCMIVSEGIAADEAGKKPDALKTLVLNGSWAFRFEDGKSFNEAGGPAFEATDTISVPGCFDAMPKWFMKRGTGLYRTSFTLDKGVERAWLVVDGMGLYGKFWIDGREIGVDDLPYSRVEIATGSLAAGEHELVAAVDNRFDWSYNKLAHSYYDFHFWGGFYHGVSLVFDDRRLFVRTRDYRTGRIEVEAVNFATKDFKTTLVFDGKVEIPVEFHDSRTTVNVPGFKLWSCEKPNLHRVAVREGKGLVAGTRFGVRTIEAHDGGLYLNGERIFLKGANRHDQHLLVGAATSEAAMLVDIQNLKEMGGNFFRCAHYPQCREFLDLCDEMGVLVWEESLGWGNGKGHVRGCDELVDPLFVEKQLEQTRLMVRNSFNHPSVIIFAFLNECESTRKDCKTLVDRLIDEVRTEDSGRLVTFACNRISQDVCLANADIVAFNTYPGTINGYPDTRDAFAEKIRGMEGFGIDWSVRHFQKRYPGKTIIISEIGTGGLYGWRDPSNPFDTEDFQDEYDGLVAETVWSNPGVAGIAFWQLFDTRTCGRDCHENGKKHVAMSWAGLFDFNRRPKLVVKTLTDWFRNKVPANLAAKIPAPKSDSRNATRPERIE